MHPSALTTMSSLQLLFSNEITLSNHSAFQKISRLLPIILSTSILLIEKEQYGNFNLLYGNFVAVY